MVRCLGGGIRSNLVWVMLCQFLLSVGPVRVRTSLYKCTVQCTLVQRTQYRAVCSTAAIADSDVRRETWGGQGLAGSEAVYKAASLRLTRPSVSTKIAPKLQNLLCYVNLNVIFCFFLSKPFTSLFCLLQMSKFRAKEWIREREMGDEKIMDLSVEKGKRWVW